MAVEGKNDDLRLSVTVNSEWPERERREGKGCKEQECRAQRPSAGA